MKKRQPFDELQPDQPFRAARLISEGPADEASRALEALVGSVIYGATLAAATAALSELEHVVTAHLEATRRPPSDDARQRDLQAKAMGVVEAACAALLADLPTDTHSPILNCSRCGCRRPMMLPSGQGWECPMCGQVIECPPCSAQVSWSEFR